mmetsp:Transcript_19266/g.39804  ORF Transcript_19266/g.39804 Transcript_19266/m.39804 type:complete len:284 (-) Transcript_19266:308-1159(-)
MGGGWECGSTSVTVEVSVPLLDARDRYCDKVRRGVGCDSSAVFGAHEHVLNEALVVEFGSARGAEGTDGPNTGVGHVVVAIVGALSELDAVVLVTVAPLVGLGKREGASKGLSDGRGAGDAGGGGYGVAKEKEFVSGVVTRARRERGGRPRVTSVVKLGVAVLVGEDVGSRRVQGRLCAAGIEEDPLGAAVVSLHTQQVLVGVLGRVIRAHGVLGVDLGDLIRAVAGLVDGVGHARVQAVGAEFGYLSSRALCVAAAVHIADAGGKVALAVTVEDNAFRLGNS